MNETKWTVEQQAAINCRGQLLVAAAAGSGKTAVLVERLIQRITDLKERVDVDRFLVLTFTKAAANEMRERIGKALDDALFKETNSAEVGYLLHQRTLLHRSSITTIHSFCMELIRQNFYIIELDPAFRVADQAEADLLRQDVVEDLFEKYYGRENKSFHNLVEAFGSDRDDQPLMENILKLYEFSTSQAAPLTWLESLTDAYSWQTSEELANSEWGNSVRQAVKDKVEESINLIKRAYQLSIQPGGPIHYLQCLEDDQVRLQMLDTTLDNGSWSEVEKFFQEASKFPKLPSGPRKSKSSKEAANPEFNTASIELKITEEKQKLILEGAKKARNDAKKKLEKLYKDLFQITLEEQLPKLKEIGELVQTLADVVKEFSKEYTQAKRQKNIVDFSDLEHFALQILIDGEELTPVALALQERFAEVMVDEYQDINSVQEKILQSVSRQDGFSPNLFMVGDVKQSIYRFRMADPRLFLAKYTNLPHWDASEKSLSEKLVIDLNRNFRSRREVIDGVNFLFRQIMTEGAGEIVYDDQAALCYGANFVCDQEQLKTAEGPIEVHLFDPQILKQSGQNQESNDAEENGDVLPFKDSREEDSANSETEASSSLSDEKTSEDEFSLEDLETARIEARLVADRIQKIVFNKEFQVYDKHLQDFRPAQYSDIAILMRSFSAIAPLYVEEFQAMGIPVYAETSSGYFGASEVETMLSLLKIIDNPRMDIPFAAVLRSAFVGLNGTELGKLRSMLPQGDFYDAFILAYWASQQLDKEICGVREPEQTMDEHKESAIEEIQEILKPYSNLLPELLEEAIKILKDAPILKDKICIFYSKLQDWRQFACQNSLADLLWYLYQETGYLAYVGTLPSGNQRQANLRALYDRACRFESTTYRGLFRFLRFLDRFQGQGKDLGSARALGENEDVVRLITVHSSKGLEFPIVFVVGLGKKFNIRSISGNLLLHSNLGVGIPLMDIDNRIRYPSFIQKAVKERLWQESLAEELRILYVALTRAKERLFLYGSLPKLDEEIQHWQSLASCTEQAFPNGQLRNAKHFLDWIGPALARHPDKLFCNDSCKAFLSENDLDNNPGSINLQDDTSSWSVILHETLNSMDHILNKTENEDIDDTEKTVSSVSIEQSPEEMYAEVDKRLSWLYPYSEAVHQISKTNVSELKRRYSWNIGENTTDSLKTPQAKDYVRPKFVQTHQELTPAERGIAFHTVMEHLPLDAWAQTWDQLSAEQQQEQIKGLIQALINHEILTAEQAAVLSVDHVLGLINSPVGKRLLLAQDVRREVPFTLMLPQGVLVQGMIDALIFSDDCKSAEILDYKTDHIRSLNFPEKAIKDRYIFQLSLYALAVENLLRIKVTQATLYSVDLQREISIPIEDIKTTQAKISL